MALGFVGVAVFAATLPATRLAVASLSPEFLTAARAAIAGLIAIPVLAVGGRAPPWRDFPKLGLCALCLAAGFPGFTGFAMRALPAAHAGVVVGALPLATAAAAALIDRERPSPAFWACSDPRRRAGRRLRLASRRRRPARRRCAAAARGRLRGARLHLVGAIVAADAGARRHLVDRRPRPAGLGAAELRLAPADPASVTGARLGLPRLSRRDEHVFRLFRVERRAGARRRRAGQPGSARAAFLTLALAAALLGERIDAETAICAILRRARLRRPTAAGRAGAAGLGRLTGPARRAYALPASRPDGRRLRAEESPGSMRTRRRITSGGGDPRDSATESKPPAAAKAGPARVKGCGKSAPRRRQRRRHGKPRREQNRIGAMRGAARRLRGQSAGLVARVGCLRRPATGVPEEWPSRREPRGSRPYRTRLTGRLADFRVGSGQWAVGRGSCPTRRLLPIAYCHAEAPCCTLIPSFPPAPGRASPPTRWCSIMTSATAAASP